MQHNSKNYTKNIKVAQYPNGLFRKLHPLSHFLFPITTSDPPLCKTSQMYSREWPILCWSGFRILHQSQLTELIFYGLLDKSLTILIIYSLKSSSHIEIQNSQSKFAIIWTSGINYSHISLISSKKTIFTI